MRAQHVVVIEALPEIIAGPNYTTDDWFAEVIDISLQTGHIHIELQPSGTRCWVPPKYLQPLDDESESSESDNVSESGDDIWEDFSDVSMDIEKERREEALGDMTDDTSPSERIHHHPPSNRQVSSASNFQISSQDR